MIRRSGRSGEAVASMLAPSREPATAEFPRAEPTAPPRILPTGGSSQPDEAEAAADFDAFYAAVARPVWCYLRAASGDASSADDLLQESFLRLLTARAAPVDPLERRRYLFRVAGNLLADRRRRRRVAERHLGLARPLTDPAPATDALDPDLERALASLSPRERQLLWLAHVEESTHSEIATLSGLLPGSVKVLLFRARRKLGALLRNRGLAPPGDQP